MSARVSYRLEDSIATIRMDDGKANVLSLAMFAEIDAAFARARSEAAAVVFGGRAGVFSAGFDLAVLRAGGPDATRLVRVGFELAERILAFPGPVVVACSGHAVAMGVFLLLAGDYRIGARGDYKLTANEVFLGIPMPHFAIEMLRQRLVPAHFQRALILSEAYRNDQAVAAGFLDRVVAADELDGVARGVALQLAQLPRDSFQVAKQRVRDSSLRAIRAAIEADGVGAPS